MPASKKIVDEEKADNYTGDVLIPERIAHFTWAWFTLTMSTGGISNLLHEQPHPFVGLIASLPRTKLMRSSCPTEGSSLSFLRYVGGIYTSIGYDMSEVLSVNLNTCTNIELASLTGHRQDNLYVFHRYALIQLHDDNATVHYKSWSTENLSYASE